MRLLACDDLFWASTIPTMSSLYAGNFKPYKADSALLNVTVTGRLGPLLGVVSKLEPSNPAKLTPKPPRTTKSPLLSAV